jgi:hypothetical protein
MRERTCLIARTSTPNRVLRKPGLSFSSVRLDVEGGSPGNSLGRWVTMIVDLPEGVEVGRGFVEQQERPVGEDRAGERDPAALPGGQSRAEFTHPRDEWDVQGGCRGGGLQFGPGRVRPADALRSDPPPSCHDRRSAGSREAFAGRLWVGVDRDADVAA